MSTRQALLEGIETLEPRLLLAVASPSIYAQYMLELINRARANPLAEAALYGLDLNDGLPVGTLLGFARQPLAFNENLISSARDHTQWMIDNDLFQHGGPGATTFSQRMATAGYPFTAPAGAGENLAWQGVSPPAVPDVLTYTSDLHRALFVDAGFLGRGHRLNILENDFKEIGVGVLAGVFQTSNAVMVTQDFAYQNGNAFITGVVYDDAAVLNNDFYTPGEGIGAVTVTAVRQIGGQTYTTTGWSSGGYSLQVTPGTYDVTFSGGGLSMPFLVTDVVMGTQNVKVDLDTSNPPPQRDVSVNSTQPDTVYATPGGEVDLSVVVRNGGALAIGGNFTMTVYQSPDNVVDNTDAAAYSYQLSSLVPGVNSSYDCTFTAPLLEGTYYLRVMADSADDIPESDETNNWSGVVTLIVGQPNLQAHFGNISFASALVPGDKGVLPVIITNAGAIPAEGVITIGVFASADNTPGGDVALASLTRAIGLMPGDSVSVPVRLTLNDSLPAGTWYFIAQADSTNVIAEGNESDNAVVSAASYELSWKFGSFGTRKNVRLVLHDGGGNLVTFSLSGDGWGDVSGGPAFSDVALHATTAKSALGIAAKALASVGNITADGNMKSIAARVNITGDITIAGGIASITVGDLGGGHSILLHNNPLVALPLKQQAAITLGQVQDLELDASDVPIKALTVLDWKDLAGPADLVSTPALGKLTVRGRRGAAPLPGDFQADLVVAGAVGAVVVPGRLNDVAWSALSIKSMRVGGNMYSASLTLAQPPDTKLVALGRLDVRGWLKDSSIRAVGNIGAVTLAGAENVDLFAGIDPACIGLPSLGGQFVQHSSIKSVKVTGAVENGSSQSTLRARLAAYFLGSVKILDAQETAGEDWGLAYHTLAGYAYTVGPVKYAWPNGLDAQPIHPAGDFTVNAV